MSTQQSIRNALLSERRTREEWRLNGLRLQLVSRFVFPRLGYRVLKGEEESWASIKKNPALLPKQGGLTPYLRDYADYIVVGKQHGVLIVDVKAPVSSRVKPWRGPFHRCRVTFSEREWKEYTTSEVPVMLLLWDYNSAKRLDEQDQPVFYALVKFKSLPPARKLTGQFEVRIDPWNLQPRRLSPPVFKKLVARCRAMEVEEIKPGCITCCARPNAGRSR